MVLGGGEGNHVGDLVGGGVMKKRKLRLVLISLLVAILIGGLFALSRATSDKGKNTEMAMEEPKTETEKVAEIVEEFGTNYSIKYRLLDDETLVVSGIGELVEIKKTYVVDDELGCRYRIRKVIIEEGITKVTAMQDMTYLEEVVLPDSVTELGEDVFYGCESLQRITIPASLESWNPTILEDCARLREIVNRSNVECEIPWYKNNVTWTVDGKKTTVIPAGKTAVATGKQIPIRYDLMGGKATGALPRSYEFGIELELPTCVEKEGYVFMGWSDYFGFPVTTVGPKKETKKIYAVWFNVYKVESNKKGQVTVTFDRRDTGNWLEDLYIRYSTEEKMDGCEIDYSDKKRDTITIKKLKPGETYYFDLVNGEYEEPELWDGFGRRKVVVRG